MKENLKVPVNLRNDDCSKTLSALGLTRLHQGKVRDTWSLRSVLGHDNYLLVAASDRISIFDFVLNAKVPKKGEVLTALTHFWLTQFFLHDNHFVSSTFDEEVNYIINLLDKIDIEDCAPRCLVVKNLVGKVWDFEMIFRYHIGGSVFEKYQETGVAGGHVLPPGLPQWSKLDEPIFTPSTKEEVGHDVNVDADYFYKVMAERGLYNEAQLAVAQLADVYEQAYRYAKEMGILILDTKFETAGLTIVDEILTPDSSRFVRESDWLEAMATGKNPKFLDKQPVRDWGTTVETPFFKDDEVIIGINKLDPKNPEHLNFVHSLIVPEEIIADTTKRYLDLFEELVEMTLEEYQKEQMLL